MKQEDNEEKEGGKAQDKSREKKRSYLKKNSFNRLLDLINLFDSPVDLLNAIVKKTNFN
jgi:hypothetical protein